jgi:hypothetical protein
VIDLTSTSADVTILGVGGGFGFPIRSGDVNGDNIEDIVIAACCIDAGEIVVIFGGGSLPNTIDLGSTPPDIDILGENAGDIFSGFPFAVKDVNNDMIDDIIAGAFLADPPGRSDAGKSYILSGRNSWPTVIDLSIVPADITIWGDDAGDASGVSIAAGDVNDDGINDIIIGAPGADPLGVSDAGEAYIIFGEHKTVIPPGDVSGTWALGGSPYEIQGEITIPDGLTLTIEPGVLVEFQGHYKFIVEGRLLAVGTETDTIVFTINDTTGFSIPDTSLGGWHGIRFNWTSPANDSSKIIYCKLQYGKAVSTG